MQHHGHSESNNPFLHEEESLEPIDIQSEDSDTKLEAKMKLTRNEKYINTTKDLHNVGFPNTRPEITLDESNKIKRKLPLTAELKKLSESSLARSDSTNNKLDSSVGVEIKGQNIDCSTPLSKEQFHDPDSEFPEDPQDIVSYERNYCNLV